MMMMLSEGRAIDQREAAGRASGWAPLPGGDRRVRASAAGAARAAGAVRAVSLATTALALAAAGCAQLAPGTWAPGTTLQQARSALVRPTGEYQRPDGGTRLEYAAGSFGSQTWMLDYDAAGRLVASEQVLTKPNFATIVAGMPQDEVRQRLGRPAYVFNAGWQQHQQVWNYRWFGGDCVWFQVAIDEASHRVASAGTGQDPACDVKSRD